MDDRPDERRAWALEPGDVILGSVIHRAFAPARSGPMPVLVGPTPAGHPFPASYVELVLEVAGERRSIQVPKKYLFRLDVPPGRMVC